MSELVEAIVGESYAARPRNIIEGISYELAHRRVPGVPHTLYEELWHIAFWQEMSLRWISGVQTPFPERPELAFPDETQTANESWDSLRERYLEGAQRAASLATDAVQLDLQVLCPSRPGEAPRTMSAREQLISLATHNAYHLGRMVLLRQLLAAWPPPSGGFTW